MSSSVPRGIRDESADVSGGLSLLGAAAQQGQWAREGRWNPLGSRLRPLSAAYRTKPRNGSYSRSVNITSLD